jgi:hypothetical protein
LIKSSVRSKRNFSSSNSGKIRFLKTKIIFQDKKIRFLKTEIFIGGQTGNQRVEKKLGGPKENSSCHES